MNSLAQFHFLRPGWLLLLIPAGLILWSIIKRRDERSAWRNVIENHLLDHLIVQPEQHNTGLSPVWVSALIFLTAILALAGPAWQREATPFTEDQAAVVIVLKVTPTMLAKDIQPSRLQRAVHKIQDLLELRPGTRNALIAYAGSAHLVMPLTTDGEIITSFAAELSPELMPLEGDAIGDAIALANQRLNRSGLPASIVVLADSIDRGQFEQLTTIREAGTADVHILALAAGPEVVPPIDSPPAPALDLDNIRAAADAIGGSLTVVSIDNLDVQTLSSSIQRSFANAPLQEETHWRDAGYYLLPVTALFLLILFREGGAVPLSGASRPQ